MAQFQRLMSRRVSALLVEGAIERSDELARYADVSVAELTNDLSRMLESSEIAQAWEQTAKKDIDKDIELVSEEELQEKITETFKQLTEETKSLCGYVEVESIKEEEKTLEEVWGEIEVEREEKETYENLSIR